MKDIDVLMHDYSSISALEGSFYRHSARHMQNRYFFPLHSVAIKKHQALLLSCCLLEAANSWMKIPLQITIISLYRFKRNNNSQLHLGGRPKMRLNNFHFPCLNFSFCHLFPLFFSLLLWRENRGSGGKAETGKISFYAVKFSTYWAKFLWVCSCKKTIFNLPPLIEMRTLYPKLLFINTCVHKMISGKKESSPLQF